LVMNENLNPLRALPQAQRFQLMFGLSVMWTTVFCTAASAWLWYGGLLAAHALICGGILLTSLTFNAASKAATRSYRDYPMSDGTARYDDVWGA